MKIYQEMTKIWYMGWSFSEQISTTAETHSFQNIFHCFYFDFFLSYLKGPEQKCLISCHNFLSGSYRSSLHQNFYHKRNLSIKGFIVL